MAVEYDSGALVDGGGETGALMRRFDWSSTALGPAQAWPQSLKSAVRIVLTSRFAMWMAWGPELTFLYNDSYARMTLGEKHPHALGMPASAVWPEIWRDIAPRIQQVMRDGVATWDEALLLFLERSGYAEETYHTFSYSPLYDDRGAIAGMLCVVTEETERVIGERRLALLRELASALATTTRTEDVLAAVEESLSTDRRDLPFTLTYLYEDDGARARLAGATGIAPGHPAAPEVLEVLEGNDTWPAAEIWRDGELLVVDHLDRRYPALPTGAWTIPPCDAAIVPIAQAGQESPAGFLVAGLNPYRRFDETCAGFVSLVAGQIGSSLANARAYEEEKSRAEALAEIDRAKTTFFSNVSHEFRTPLTLMLGPLEDLLRDGQLPAEAAEALRLMQRNGQRLLKLVNTLLEFSRIEAGRVRASYQAVDLAAYTSDLVSTFRSAVDRAGMRLVIDTPPLPEPVYVDGDMWEKIVLNLVSNAFKYTLEGGISVSLRADAGQAVLTVHDTGTGIPEDELPKLFNRFHRVEGARARTHEGTGIGLALVQELVRLHGGTVEASSIEGHGSTFTVRIPLGTAHLPPDRINNNPEWRTSVGNQYADEALRWMPDSGAAPAGDEDANAPLLRGLSGTNKRSRILLADDNADMRGYVRRLLSVEYDVVEVSDGTAALEAARRLAPDGMPDGMPDLILTDVMMPNLDGFGLLRALREQSETAAIPVIMLSARAGEEARVEGLNAGADDYLVKPFAARELLARVSNTLALAKVRREAQQMLESERRGLREIFERSPAFITTLRGPDHVFEMVNPHYQRLVGEGRQILGRPVVEALPEVIDQGFIQLLDSVYRTGEPFVGREVSVIIDRGPGLQERIVDFLYHPTRDTDGSVTGIFVHGVDVTDQVESRRKVEQQAAELERTVALLQEQSAVNQTITDNATSALLMLDEEGRATFMNPTAEAVTGFTLAEMEARSMHQILHHTRPDGTPFPDSECILTAHVRRGQALQDHRDTFIRRDGTFYPVSVALAPVAGGPGPGQRSSQFVLEFRDITSELEAEQVLREANRRKDEFLATLSHELRTPLTAILGWARMLRIAADDPEVVRTAVETIEQSARVQAQLIDDVLDVSRITSGKVRIEPKAIDVSQIAAAAADAVRLAATARGLTFRVDTEPGALSAPSATILGDPSRLQQIIWNLLTNAIKFTNEGGQVRMSVSTSESTVTIRVRDTGIGIRPDFVPYVFEPFRQAESSTTRAYGGLGLGLSIVRYLVELHGGSIVAESEGEGRGATFTISLPRLRNVPEPDAAPEKERAGRGRTLAEQMTDLQGASVLVIDDQPSIRAYIAAVLERAHATVHTAASVREAIRVIETTRVSLVLCDIAMPDEDGFAFLHWMRAGEPRKHVPVVAITAFGRNEDEEQILTSGFDGYIRKPVEPERLTRAVRETLDRV
jgi:PAS domain S-box-containing protein